MTDHVDCFYAALNVLVGHGHVKQRLIEAYEEHLAEMRPRRMILTHMSEEMLYHPDRDRFETAEDGKVVTIG